MIEQATNLEWLMQENECDKHQELWVAADSILKKIHSTIEEQKKIMKLQGVSSDFLVVDKQLELLMGEKERAVGALREHDKEHGCQDSKAVRNPDEPAEH